MKKLLFVIIIIFFFVSAFSQTRTGFGVKGGLNLSKVTGPWKEELQTDVNINPKFNAGTHFGVYFEIPVVENKLEIQPEILFSVKGVKFKESYSQTETTPLEIIKYEGAAEEQEELFYLQFPLLFKYNINSFSLFAGVYYAFLLDASLEGSTEENISTTNIANNTTTTSQNLSSYNYDGTNGFNDNDFGIIAGIEYQFTFPLGLTVRYEKGLDNTFGKDLVKEKFTNSTLQFGVKFRLISNN